MSLRRTLSRNVTFYRTKAGLSKKQLASKAKMTHRYVNHLEKEDPNPTLDVLERVAKATGVTVSHLVATKHETEAVPDSPHVVDGVISLLKSALDLLEQFRR